jgi:AcrR family transcriptional regulator
MPHTGAIRARILKAALRSFSEKGYHRTTIYDVGHSIHVREECITELFRSKADLFMAALYAANTARSAHVPGASTMRSHPNFKEAAMQMMDAIYKAQDKQFLRMRLFGYLERPDLMRKFIEDTTTPYFDAIADRLRIERTNGRIRKDVHIDSAAAAMFFLSGFRRVTEQLGAKQGPNLARRDMNYFSDIWLHGVLEQRCSDRESIASNRESEISTELQE